jgi:propanol-preferring alcohol dehydrogenase
MRAAVVTDFHAPLEIREVPVPEPGPGQVLVRMEASGLCHTDIHAAHGDWPVKPTPPFVPGHEGVGIVEKLGAGVTNRHVGQRVAIACRTTPGSPATHDRQSRAGSGPRPSGRQ